MASTKKVLLTILLFVLCCLCVPTDAGMPNCTSTPDKCQCPRNYTSFKNELNDEEKNCLKIVSEKMSWEKATETCANESSLLVDYKIPDSLLQDFRNRGVNFIWTGIRKRLAFYIAEGPREYMFRSSNDNGLVFQWEDGEPVHDCAALSISSGRLVTRDCDTELEYLCQNFGLPLYPVSKSLACPKEWLFFYQLPVGTLRCVKAFSGPASGLGTRNETATCLELGSQVADVQDFLDLYVYMSQLNIPGIVPTDSKNFCQTKYIESVLGGHIKENVSCLDKIDICAKDTRKISLNPKVSPDFSDSVQSATIQQTLLTCEVPFKSRNFSEIEPQLHYTWYVDEIPIWEDSYILNLSSYPVYRLFSSSAHRQGTYRCVVRVEGITARFSSQYVNYFHSDVKTYIVYMQADLKSVLNVDFSQAESFSTLMRLVNDSMADGIKGIFKIVREPEWDYQMSWKNEENVTVQLLFYNYFDDESDRYFDESTLERDLKMKLLTNLSFNSSISLEVDRADTCFEQAVPSSSTSHNAFKWKRTQQTKLAVSEPMCLNDWRLVTRKCRPSNIWRATWGRFNVSQCTKNLTMAKELPLESHAGFKNVGPNLFMFVFHTGKTYEEAEELCRNRSSVLVDLKVQNKIIPYITLGYRYWISNRKDLTYQAKDQWFENNSTINRKNRTLLCASDEDQPSRQTFFPKKCDPTETYQFNCMHQPFVLLNSFIFSKSWHKYSHKQASYYIEHSEKNWHEANKSCHAFPAKSTLLQGIRKNSEEYSVFKLLLRQLGQDSEESSWWMNLFQDGDSLKWLSSPEESPTFVDWERHTDFDMDRSAGVLTVTNRSAHWSLRDLSSEQRSICEMQDLKDSHPTAVYIEERANVQEEDGTYKVDLQCVPSGWFVYSSIIWFKDADAINTETSQQSLHLDLKTPFGFGKVSEFQGYYYCSIALDNPTKNIFSPKLLVTFPGLHTFVLHMKSKIPKYSKCSDIHSLKLPFIEEFNKYLDLLHSNGSRLFLKNVTCNNSVISSYHHFYILKDKGNEKELQNFLKSSISSGNGTLFESLKKLNINKDDVTLRSTVSCPKEMTHYDGHHLTWPETPIGQNTFPDEMCITAEGSALERKCLGDFYTGAHWSLVEKDCAGVQHKLTVSLQTLSKTNITEDNIVNTTMSMEMLTTASEDLLSPPDVEYVARILRNVASVSSIEPGVLRSVVLTVDTVIDTFSTSENRDILSMTPTKISSAVESIAMNVQTNEQAVKVAGNNIAVSVLPRTLIPRGGVLKHWGSNVTILLNDSDRDPDEWMNRLENFEAALLLPVSVLAEKGRNNRSDMAIVVRRNSQLLRNIEVISPVIDVVMGTGPVYDIDPPLHLVFNITEMKSRERNANWGCASWDQMLNSNLGGWSYKGCVSVLIDTTHVRCYCNHLTSLAVILEINPSLGKTPKVHSAVMSVITYIGCSLSIFGLGIVILTFAIFRKWRTDMKHKILFNLSLSLILLLLVFLIGVKNTGWGYGCMVVAVLLHYFMLASFSWMLVEAFLHYLCLVKVIGTYIPHFLQKAMLFAWGIPVLIVGIVLGVNPKLYSGDEYCWLSGDVLYFAVAFPVSTLLAINFIIFGVIFFSLTCGGSKQTLRTNQDQKKDMVARAKAMFCVSVLLGLSWIFGFLAAMEGTKLVFEYLFVITTTLQGFLFFVVFVLRQKNTRELWQNLVKRTPKSGSSQPIELIELKQF